MCPSALLFLWFLKINIFYVSFRCITVLHLLIRIIMDSEKVMSVKFKTRLASMSKV